MPKKALSTIYRGTREDYSEKTGSPAIVTVDGKTLDPRPSQKLHNHSPDGFEWGYGGSGPAQLSLAILLDYYGAEWGASYRRMGFGDRENPLNYYQDFKFHTIARLAQDAPWQISGAGIELAMREIMAKEAGAAGQLRKAFP